MSVRGLIKLTNNAKSGDDALQRAYNKEAIDDLLYRSWDFEPLNGNSSGIALVSNLDSFQTNIYEYRIETLIPREPDSPTGNGGRIGQTRDLTGLIDDESAFGRTYRFTTLVDCYLSNFKYWAQDGTATPATREDANKWVAWSEIHLGCAEDGIGICEIYVPNENEREFDNYYNRVSRGVYIRAIKGFVNAVPID